MINEISIRFIINSNQCLAFFLKNVNVFVINGLFFLCILIIKSDTTIFFQKLYRGYSVILIHVVYLPISNIIHQLSYYRCWFFSHNLVNTPFSQLILENLIIIIPCMSWITFINIIVRFTLCNST